MCRSRNKASDKTLDTPLRQKFESGNAFLNFYFYRGVGTWVWRKQESRVEPFKKHLLMFSLGLNGALCCVGYDEAPAALAVRQFLGFWQEQSGKNRLSLKQLRMWRKEWETEQRRVGNRQDERERTEEKEKHRKEKGDRKERRREEKGKRDRRET